jgi:hypothetical protein
MKTKEYSSISELMDSINEDLSWWDKYISIPLSKYIYNPLSTFYYDLINFPKNLIRWLPVIWKWRPFDYRYSLIVLKTSLEGQLDQFNHALNIRGFYHVGIERDIKNITICINLLDRIIKDDYIIIDNKIFRNKKAYYKRVQWQEKHDIEYLSKLISKYINHWWD